MKRVYSARRTTLSLLSIIGLFVTVLFGCRIVTVADFVFLVHLLQSSAINNHPRLPSSSNTNCQVLILNHKHNYHYEVLESILALYPLPNSRDCNHGEIYFTFVIAYGEEKELYFHRSQSWYEYATQHMVDREYTTVVAAGQSRYVQEVIRNSSYVVAVDDEFDYQIRASCYCNNDDLEWLYEDDGHYCLFHEACGDITIKHAVWLHPQIQPSFFPSILPQQHQDDPRPIIMQKAEEHQYQHHLCIIGEAKRREYDLVAQYLWSHPFFSNIFFHHFGMGRIPKVVQPFAKQFALHANPNFTSYQYDLYDTCDAILSLVTPVQHSEYFVDRRKVSGGIVQAVAYRKPILLHHELADVYASQLLGCQHVETHGNDADSFVAGFERLLERLDILKEAEEERRFEEELLTVIVASQ